MAVAFILFFGGNAPTPIERRLDAVRLAIAVHLLQAASKAQFDPIVVVSPDPAVHAGLRRYADVDRPSDATILARDMRCPPEVRAAGAWEREIGPHIDRIAALFVTPDVEVVIAGRVGAPVWSFLETQTACRVRMLSEERGMQAA